MPRLRAQMVVLQRSTETQSCKVLGNVLDYLSNSVENWLLTANFGIELKDAMFKLRSQSKNVSHQQTIYFIDISKMACRRA